MVRTGWWLASSVIASGMLVACSSPVDTPAPRTATHQTAGTPPAEAELDALAVELTSDDVESLAEALALPIDQIPAEVISGLPGLDIAFDDEAATPVGEAWSVPATVTDSSGVVTTWAVIVVRSGDDLVFVDSTPSGP